jgi:hypothetical protein
VRCESDEGRFGLSYDRLVVAVGSTTNTFGTTGVDQHCLFMKEVGDGITTRTKIFEQFEKATVPLAGSAAEIDAEREIMCYTHLHTICEATNVEGLVFSSHFALLQERGCCTSWWSAEVRACVGSDDSWRVYNIMYVCDQSCDTGPTGVEVAAELQVHSWCLHTKLV